MIRKISHRGLKRLHESGETAGIRPDLVPRVRQIMTLLDAAADIRGMDLPPFRLHPLKGKLKGFWAVTVRANWRIVFRFENGDAYDVDLVDYH
jgi:proteic killer suppression protein